MLKNKTIPLDAYTPKEKVYPINYVCKYVNHKKDEVLAKEQDSLTSLQAIGHALSTGTDLMVRMEQYLSRVDEDDDAIAIKDALSHHLEDLSKDMQNLQESLDTVMNEMTEKSLMFEDISNMLEQTEPLITKMMYQDNLTCAYNRYYYITHEQLLFSHGQHDCGMSVAFFDIDDFKHFNTDYGHDFGDVVLQRFASYVTEILRHNDECGLVRMGGDEFVIIANALPYSEFVGMIKRICREVGALTASLNGQTASIHVSCGVANSLADQTENTDILYKLADDRLYKAKAAGKNQVVWV